MSKAGKGYVICRWIQDLEYQDQTKRDVCVGWMPLASSKEATEDDMEYTGLYKAFERYLTKGYTTEILEVVPVRLEGKPDLGERVSWWRNQTKEIYGE